MSDQFAVLGSLLERREKEPTRSEVLNGERQLAWAVVAQWMRDVLKILNGETVFDESPQPRRKRGRPGRPQRRVLTLEDLRAWLDTEICAFWVEGVLGGDVAHLKSWFEDITRAYREAKDIPEVILKRDYGAITPVSWDVFEVHLPQQRFMMV